MKLSELRKVLSSAEIRKLFVDYFTLHHDHCFVRSSPVVPFGDPSVAFVNSGMNQFKSIFLGKSNPIHKRICNSQKCIRVGGKHNDLSIVGQDSYHHTFFEMLGNWSFGDYFKLEACEMALDLLCGPFNINPGRLYVTYFAGDRELGLPADLECLEIWRKLGFPSSRILPFGIKENFWEMGPVGPCGPCTEIHIDHRYAGIDRTRLVNAGVSDVTELWNLVFIQYNRNTDGSISKLPNRHVDTGMGFERLTAVLQNKNSNYDTDLFIPIFDQIEKVANVPKYEGSFSSNVKRETLDTGYRILADHTRMIAICLADGMLPDQNQKLRRVLRKAFVISKNVFSNEHLLPQLIPVVIDILGSAYPELDLKRNAILELIDHEKEVFKELQNTSSKGSAEILAEFPKLDYVTLLENPGIVPAYREIIKQKDIFKNNTIPGILLYKLSETYGITTECFKKLAEMETMLLDEEGYAQIVANVKFKFKDIFTSEKYTKYIKNGLSEALSVLTKDLPPTDISCKYFYKYNDRTKQYIIPTLSGRVLGILKSDNSICDFENKFSISSNDIIFIVTDRSNFYNQSGGQQSDRGKISIRDDKQKYDLHVIDVDFLNDCVVHICRPLDINDEIVYLSVGTKVDLIVDLEHRTMNTIHHTGVHMLNAAFRTLYDKIIYQVSSGVSRDFLRLELGLIGKRVNKKDVQDIEDLISKVIASSTSVDVQIITASDVMQQGDIIVVPGESYPEINLRLINIIIDKFNFRSKELCCGTHVLNTREVERMCITNVKQTNRARYAFTAVAGPIAKKILKTATVVSNRVDYLQHHYETANLASATEKELQKIRNKILHSDVLLPFVFKMDILDKISGILTNFRKTSRKTLEELMEDEIKNVLIKNQNHFILHYLSSAEFTEEVRLRKATKFCTDRPILVAAMSNNIIKARCFVPKKHITQHFNATLWLKEFASIFKSLVSSPKGQNAEEICNMNGKKIISFQFKEQLKLAMEKANNFAKTNSS